MESVLDGELRNPAKHQLFFDSIGRDLSGSDHDKFCHGMRHLMRLIGWQAELRGKTEGDTDVLATCSFSNVQRALIIEGKPEMEAGRLSRFAMLLKPQGN